MVPPSKKKTLQDWTNANGVRSSASKRVPQPSAASKGKRRVPQPSAASQNIMANFLGKPKRVPSSCSTLQGKRKRIHVVSSSSSSASKGKRRRRSASASASLVASQNAMAAWLNASSSSSCSTLQIESNSASTGTARDGQSQATVAKAEAAATTTTATDAKDAQAPSQAISSSDEDVRPEPEAKPFVNNGLKKWQTAGEEWCRKRKSSDAETEADPNNSNGDRKNNSIGDDEYNSNNNRKYNDDGDGDSCFVNADGDSKNNSNGDIEYKSNGDGDGDSCFVNGDRKYNGEYDCTVVWKGNCYQVTKPMVLEDDDTIDERLKQLSKVAEIMEHCCPRHQQKVETLMPLVKHCFRILTTKNTWSPKPIKRRQSLDDPAGVYALSKDSRGSILKYGMSFDCHERVSQQDLKFAFKLADRTDLQDLLPDDVIDPIVTLELPGIQYHSDHMDRSKSLIRMQIFEAYLAAIHETCITKTVLERLLQSPPSVVEELQSIQPWKDPDHQEYTTDFLAGFREHGIFNILTWPTMKSRVYHMAKQSFPSYLGSRIRKDLPEGEFCNLYWILALFGKDNHRGWQNSLEDSPRETTLKEVVRVVEPLLESADVNPDDERLIREALGTITGENRGGYVRPETSELREAFVEGFKTWNQERPKKEIFSVEKSMFVDAYKNNPWMKEEVDGGRIVHLFNEFDLALVTTKSGRRIIVTRSFFLAFSPEDVDVGIRKKTIESMLVLLNFMEGLNIHTEDYVKPIRNALVSYLMRLNFGEGAKEELSTSGAARYSMPSGHMLGPMRNCMVVSNNIGSGMCVHEHFYLQFLLSENKFRNLLKILGLMRNENQRWWPSHPKWKCPGPPGTRKYRADTCNCDVNAGAKYTCMIGADIGSVHPFYGLFLCENCSPRLLYRQVDVLLEQKKSGELSEDEERYLQKLQKRLERERPGERSELRDRHIERDGHEPVLQSERVRYHNFSATKEHREKKSEANKRVYKENKPSGPKRDLQNNRQYKPYPPLLAWMLEESCLLLFRFYEATDKDGPRKINWSSAIRGTMIRVIETELDNYPEVQLDGLNPDGKLHYRRPQFIRATKKYLELAPDEEQYWRVKREFAGKVVVREKMTGIKVLEKCEATLGQVQRLKKKLERAAKEWLESDGMRGWRAKPDCSERVLKLRNELGLENERKFQSVVGDLLRLKNNRLKKNRLYA